MNIAAVQQYSTTLNRHKVTTFEWHTQLLHVLFFFEALKAFEVHLSFDYTFRAFRQLLVTAASGSGCCPTLPAFANFNGNGKVGLIEEMSPEELGGLRKVFDMFDANHDGFLTLEELCAYMEKLSCPMTKAGLLKILKSCDWNNDGRLDFNEFVALTQTLQSGDDQSNGSAHATREDSEMEEEDPKADMKDAFKVFDKDGNGLISPTELRDTLCELGLLSSRTCLARIHSMIERVDTDGDGHVSFLEFETMMGGK
ncbi:hypothetical protein GOP47_0013427 [Adiantum capillus-veneris]|uniref:EF-hand domain-containing protein n=1 Tax=Adiantum capillus-veneris TaxID=13818 RepID=A0A9D4UP71_ADICA|nr:hypothetical protein GOP47_0013427 [Adiantum capillus-veneris]